MATPVYNGGRGYRRGGYHHRRWGQNPGPADNGWLGQLGSWLGGGTPTYAGQPTGETVGGAPVYLPAPPSTGHTGAVTTTSQATASVIVVPQS